MLRSAFKLSLKVSSPNLIGAHFFLFHFLGSAGKHKSNFFDLTKDKVIERVPGGRRGLQFD